MYKAYYIKAPQLWPHFTLYCNDNKQHNVKSTSETTVSVSW